jgi:hypothetical protein
MRRLLLISHFHHREHGPASFRGRDAFGLRTVTATSAACGRVGRLIRGLRREHVTSLCQNHGRVWISRMTRFGGRALLDHLGRSLRAVAAPAACGYAVVALFVAVYAVARTRWPQLPDNTILVIAVLLAAPLALAFLWPRLAGFKAFGFEVSLAQATVHLEAEIVAPLRRSSTSLENKRLSTASLSSLCDQKQR